MHIREGACVQVNVSAYKEGACVQVNVSKAKCMAFYVSVCLYHIRIYYIWTRKVLYRHASMQLKPIKKY